METVVSPEQEGRSVLLLDFGLVNEGVWDLVSLNVQMHQLDAQRRHPIVQITVLHF
jgi:hypothetical protein